MTPERWQRVKDVFSSASVLPEVERAVFLVDACGGDAALLAEVRSLLGAHATEDAIVDRPAAALVAGDPAWIGKDPWIGRRIGQYEIVSLIGHGGMGEVYRALRVDTEYEKEVAIKLVPGGYQATYILQRLRAERQILATLEHPNIARLIDGGATEEGSPYLVMELVEGEPLDRYAATRGLSVRDRLRLFRDVCGAVSYAHQRLVVHRDLKPGNILVTADGAVKLLDFGIAKLLQPPSSDAATAATVTVMHALTPGYSSPEQLLGKTITTASDVYSLGVVLYVLLTGRSPYRGALDTAEDAIHAVCETEPVRPSTAAREASASRAGTINRDLDAIILRALRKEPDRRYTSVEQLSEDVRRHLEGLPVSARGEELGYRMGKFLRRHRVEVAAALLLALTLIGATVMSVRQARVAEAERARAERHFASVRGLANAFMFDVNDAIEELPGAMRAREVLVGTALKYLDSLSQEAGDDTGLKVELAAAFEKIANIQGQAYSANKGDPLAAIASYGRALALLENVATAEPGNTRVARALARVSMMQSRLLLLQGKIKEAVAGSGRAVDLLERLLKSQLDADMQSELAAALTVHGVNHFYAGTPRDDRLAYPRRSVALLENLARNDPENLDVAADLSSAYNTLAMTLTGNAPDRTVNEESLALYRKALAIDERLVAESGGQNVEHMRSAFVVQNNLAIQLYEVGDVRAALEAIRAGKALLGKRGNDPGDMQVRIDASIVAWHEGRFLFALGDVRASENTLKNNVKTIDERGFEKDNLQMAFVRGASETVLGRIEAERASRRGIEPADQLRHWNEARGWFQQAIPRFARVTAVATLDYMDMRAVNDARAGLARSEAAIANLESPAVATTAD